jgi:signal peptide peptidase SppA
MNLMRIASRVINRPLLVLPSVAEVVQSVLGERIGTEAILAEWESPNHTANRFAGTPVGGPGNRLAYTLVGDTAVVPVVGELVNRGAHIGAESGLVSYEGISAQIMAAAQDTRAARLLLDIESPGGEAVGAMELAALVRKVSAEKPVFAFVNGMAASAGYAAISGTKRIYSVESGISGSIGVVLIHLDRSAELEKKGIKPTLITAGAHKADANPFGPLSTAVAADLQAEVMQLYDLFVSTVAAGRKGLSAKAIRATEARTFIGKDAMEAGLVDAIASFDEVLAEISTRAAGRSTGQKGAKSMSDTTGAPAATNAGPTLTQADLDRAVADARMSGYNDAMAKVSNLTASEKIKGQPSRMTAAIKFAAKSAAMTSEEIIALVDETVPLAEAPKTAPVASIEERTAVTGVNGIAPATGAPPKSLTPIADVMRAMNGGAK